MPQREAEEAEAVEAAAACLLRVAMTGKPVTMAMFGFGIQPIGSLALELL